MATAETTESKSTTEALGTGFLVAAVAHAPFGSHPAPTQGYVRRDDEAYFDYHRQSRDREGFLAWLEEWVLGVDGHEGYMRKLGSDRVAELKPSHERMAAPVSYSY